MAARRLGLGARLFIAPDYRSTSPSNGLLELVFVRPYRQSEGFPTSFSNARRWLKHCSTKPQAGSIGARLRLKAASPYLTTEDAIVLDRRLFRPEDRRPRERKRGRNQAEVFLPARTFSPQADAVDHRLPLELPSRNHLTTSKQQSSTTRKSKVHAIPTAKKQQQRAIYSTFTHTFTK